MGKTKGYKLTSSSGDGPKVCAFFFSEQGCRNGSNCKVKNVDVDGVYVIFESSTHIACTAVFSREAV